MVKLCPEMSPEPTCPRRLVRGLLEASSPAWLPHAATPCSHGRCAAALQAPSTMHALPEGMRGAPPSIHAQSLGCKSPPCQSDTHLFFQLRKYHQVFCREHTPQPGTPTAAPGWSTGGRLWAPTPPRQPAQPVWVGSPAPCQGQPAPRTPLCTCKAPQGAAHGAGLSPGAPCGLLARWLGAGSGSVRWCTL